AVAWRGKRPAVGRMPSRSSKLEPEIGAGAGVIQEGAVRIGRTTGEGLVMTLRHHSISVCHWTQNNISEQCFGISRSFRPQEVSDDCSFPAISAPHTRFLAMRAPNSSIARPLYLARSLPHACTCAERLTFRHRIHRSANPLYRNHC